MMTRTLGIAAVAVTDVGEWKVSCGASPGQKIRSPLNLAGTHQEGTETIKLVESKIFCK